MAGSIGEIAEQVVAEVRSSKLTKLAQHQTLKEAQSQPVVRTSVGKLLMKLAEDVKHGSTDITTEDLESFLSGVSDAIKAS
jgi:hypothetical protein